MMLLGRLADLYNQRKFHDILVIGKMPKEIELKYLLSEKSFNQLLNATRRNFANTRRQHNRYFDTPQQSLARRQMAVRVRTVGAKHVLTVKRTPSHKRPVGLSVRDEWECPLSASQLKHLLENPAHPSLCRLAPWKAVMQALPAAVLGKLQCNAQMWTERTTLRMGPGIELELDKVTLESGDVFYEVELETQQPAKARAFLLQVFKAVGIRARPIRRTKLARVMQAKRK
jgi:inorganic triphosphatase YgiF